MIGGLDSRTEGCLSCQAPCPRSIGRFTISGSPRRARKQLAIALEAAGFEIGQKVRLSELTQERMHLDVPRTELLYLNHPPLLLQCLFIDGDPALLFPAVAIIRTQRDSTDICFCSVWSGDGIQMGGLSEHLAEQSKKRLLVVASKMRPTLN